MDKLKKLTDV